MKNRDLKDLFNLIHSKGEGVFKKVHILINTREDDVDNENKIRYRIYHADGFCFDVSREYCPKEDRDDFTGYDDEGNCYEFFASYEGFQDVDVGNCLRIMKRSLKPKELV